MVATVKLYYNTGLGPGNCLDSISKLDTLGFTSRECPQVAILQDRGRVDIRINISYDNVKDADYCKINNVGYWVIGIAMLNENVASLTLQQDFITTIGISNITILGGWCTRRCVTDDTLFANVIPEDFVPMHELVVDGCTEISNGVNSSGHINVLLSNINLLDLEAVAEAYTDIDDNKVLVPQLPSVSGGNTLYTFHPNGVSTYTTNISMTTAYNPNNSDVLEGVKKLRSLGIESAIGASYQIPSQWVTADESGGVYTLLVDNWHNTRSNFGTKWGSYKNNKVYSGQFQTIVCYSICSGERSEFSVEDIVDSSGNVNWTLFADVRYNGYPACKPSIFKSKSNDSQFGVIKGAGWQQTPFMYNAPSGYAVDTSAIIRDTMISAKNARMQAAFDLPGQLGSVAEKAVMSTAVNNMAEVNNMGIQNSFVQGQANNFANIQYGTSMVGTAGSAISNLGHTVVNAVNLKRSMFTGITDIMRKLTPDIQFPMIPQLQDFLGNKFYEMRYRLADVDMQRFDNYLTAFGYAVYEPLTKDCFGGRTNFNFVQADDVNIKSNFPLYFNTGAIDQIQAGVRIWHTAPSRAKLYDNPIS